MDNLSPHPSCIPRNVNENERVVCCVSLGSRGLGSSFVEAVDFIEMKWERIGLLFSRVNEKLLLLCVRVRTAGVMWERGHSQKGCLSRNILYQGIRG